MSLLDLYGHGSPQVHLHNMAVSDFSGTAQFRKFPTGLENTIVNHKHNQFDNPDYQCVNCLFFFVITIARRIVVSECVVVSPAGSVKVYSGSF